MAPLIDAADLGIATEVEKAALASWRAYRIEVSRVRGALPTSRWASGGKANCGRGKRRSNTDRPAAAQQRRKLGCGARSTR
ncbi:hypothetical protein CTI14_51060 [Methylobacterium radiotolerans]|nr:hypothetical protein CTI14_51060 [Methylobacterium radiotolerans]